MEAKRGNDKKLRSLRSFNIASLIEWFMMKFVVIVSPHFTSSAFVLFGCTILGAALRDFTIVQKMWGNLPPSRFLTSPTNSCIIRDGWHPFCTPISINLLILSWNDQSIFAILFTFHEPEKHQSAFCYYHKVYKWPLRIGPTITYQNQPFSFLVFLIYIREMHIHNLRVRIRDLISGASPESHVSYTMWCGYALVHIQYNLVSCTSLVTFTCLTNSSASSSTY